MQKLLVPTGLCALMLLTACPRSKHDVNCTNANLIIIATGFDSSDLTGATVLLYNKNDSFVTAIDSGSLQLTTYVPGASQLALYTTNGTGTHLISPVYDYKILLPALGRTYKLSGMEMSGVTRKSLPYRDPPYHCFNDVVKCNVDGTPVAVRYDPNATSYQSFDTLYLQK
jgi:hypothetical protein